MSNHTASPHSPSQSRFQDRDPLSPHFTVLEFFAAVNEVGARVIPDPMDEASLLLLSPDPNRTDDATERVLEVLRAELVRLDRVGGKEFMLALFQAESWHDRVRVDLLRAMPYVEYLRSNHWQEKRREAIERALHACQVCNSPDDIHVHHRTYANRGEELPSDLTVLCATCHSLFHNNGRLAE